MKIINQNFTDEEGRTLILRGCNLGGSSKRPFPAEGEAVRPSSLEKSREVSFVGRPFPLEEAEEHFERLSRWGFTFIRLVITWEALEHQGPGIYDEAYLAYLRKLLLIAGEKGLSVFMDPHQDVWSRWTGGDGAPAWTLEKLGMDLERLDETGAAVTEQRYGELNNGAPYPRMLWPSNYSRYAAATMFTLFFAGNTYAPGTLIDGEPAQDWLQGRYLAAMRHCFRRLKNCKAIAGWGTMNEPHPGFIGWQNLEKRENCILAMGPMPKPLEAMAAASGWAMPAAVYTSGVQALGTFRRQTINPRGLPLFKEGFACPWKKAGVWTDEGGRPRLLRKGHFALYNGRPARFCDDFLKPFMLRFTNVMREADEKTFIFIEGVPQKEHPSWQAGDPPAVVHAFHWYDGFSLFTKTFRPWLTVDTGKLRPVVGRKHLAAYFAAQLGELAARTRSLSGTPSLLGEFGLAFDINQKRAYKDGDYSIHEEALAMYYDAIDANLLSSTIWNYTADNTHERGDHWNGEDLSIFHQGKGRAEGGWLRPYPMATAGTPLSISWDRKKGLFEYRFRADGKIKAPTEIYLPPEFGPEPVIEIFCDTAGEKTRPSAEYRQEALRLLIRHNGWNGEIRLLVSRP